MSTSDIQGGAEQELIELRRQNKALEEQITRLFANAESWSMGTEDPAVSNDKDSEWRMRCLDAEEEATRVRREMDEVSVNLSNQISGLQEDLRAQKEAHLQAGEEIERFDEIIANSDNLVQQLQGQIEDLQAREKKGREEKKVLSDEIAFLRNQLDKSREETWQADEKALSAQLEVEKNREAFRERVERLAKERTELGELLWMLTVSPEDEEEAQVQAQAQTESDD